MPTPLDFMHEYRNLSVPVVIEAAKMCRKTTLQLKLHTYFMMNWDEGTPQRTAYNRVTRDSNNDKWFRDHSEGIRNAAMGKGSPHDYARALEWAVRSGRVEPNQGVLQDYCDRKLGIDCSGFVTNYLIACRKKPDSSDTVRNTSAASYFDNAHAVNDPTAVRQGDVLVWMRDNSVRHGPGHVALVQSHHAQCRPGGNLHIVEATNNALADPKLVDSHCHVEDIIEPSRPNDVMILVVRRFGQPGTRLSVMRY